MNQTHITPVHPGEVLKDDNEICRGKRGISAEMAVKLSKALGGSPQFWLNLQNNWELSQLNYSNFKNIHHVGILGTSIGILVDN
jgi:plasmid maintenance system antidote protein VapI